MLPRCYFTLSALFRSFEVKVFLRTSTDRSVWLRIYSLHYCDRIKDFHLLNSYFILLFLNIYNLYKLGFYLFNSSTSNCFVSLQKYRNFAILHEWIIYIIFQFVFKLYSEILYRNENGYYHL